MPAVDRFESTARRVRRRLRALPVLEPLANRVGMVLWRRHLDRVAQQHGLTLPRQVHLDPRLVSTEAALDGPVAVRFDSSGRTALVSGRAAVEAALRDGAATVPATVAQRHPRWARLARRVMAYAQQRGGNAYQPYLHPDLAAMPSDQGHERFPALLEALPLRSGTLVDLGANAGYFSHRFAAAGFDPIAVERSEKEAYFLTALRDAMGRNFQILKGSLTEVPLPPKVDVVLALNIFHHFLKAEASYVELTGFLRRLDTRYMLFEPHLPDDPQMRQAPHNMGPEEFARFVASTAGLETVERLGTAADGRPLFLLSAAGEAAPQR